MNPYEHQKVATKNAFAVDAGEAIVIYKSGANASSTISGENGTIGDGTLTETPGKSARKVIRYDEFGQIKNIRHPCAFGRRTSSKSTLRHGPLQYIPSVDELVKPLTRHFARQDEYLEIQDKNGEISIMEGPCSLLFDPIDHKVCLERSINHLNGVTLISRLPVCSLHASPTQNIALSWLTPPRHSPGGQTTEYCVTDPICIF